MLTLFVSSRMDESSSSGAETPPVQTCHVQYRLLAGSRKYQQFLVPFVLVDAISTNSG